MSANTQIVLLPRARLDLAELNLHYINLSDHNRNTFQQLLDDSALEKTLVQFYLNKQLVLKTITSTRIFSTCSAESACRNLNNKVDHSFDRIIFVSKNAGVLARILLDERFFQEASLFSVGKSCLVFFKQQGFPIISAKEESAQGLLSLPEFSNIKGKKILICKGAKGLIDLQEACELRGAQVEVLDLYQREGVPSIILPEQNIAEIYGVSVFALKHLLAGVLDHEVNKLLKTPLSAMSERIAQAASDLGFENVSILKF